MRTIRWVSLAGLQEVVLDLFRSSTSGEAGTAFGQEAWCALPSGLLLCCFLFLLGMARRTPNEVLAGSLRGRRVLVPAGVRFFRLVARVGWTAYEVASRSIVLLIAAHGGSSGGLFPPSAGGSNSQERDKDIGDDPDGYKSRRRREYFFFKEGQSCHQTGDDSQLRHKFNYPPKQPWLKKTITQPRPQRPSLAVKTTTTSPAVVNLRWPRQRARGLDSRIMVRLCDIEGGP